MNLDITYCASPNCQNSCGRKLTDDIKLQLTFMAYKPISMAYFCGEPNPYVDHIVDINKKVEND